MRPTSWVSSMPVSGPRTRITIGSSPNLRCRSSVACAAAPSLSTKVDGEALGSRRRASSAPTSGQHDRDRHDQRRPARGERREPAQQRADV